MFELRPYQQEAVDSLFDYFRENTGNPLLVLPTASGKSIIQAAFIKKALDLWPNERFLLLSHVKELLVQNKEKAMSLLPCLSVGIFSAGLNEKSTDNQIIIAGIQSCHKHAHKFGNISIIIVDEAHLVSKNEDSMYRKFFDEIKKYCPFVKIIGMSATPFRLDSGPLHKGSKRIFTDIAYCISIKELIEKKFLCNIETAKNKFHVNVDHVKKRGGEYIQGELEQAVNHMELIEPAIIEAEKLAENRNSWLVFCVGVEHAKLVCKVLNDRGHNSVVVVGNTPKQERDEALKLFKEKKIKALVSVGVLTTGFDAPCADTLICLRPTESPGLWVQIVGRVTRLYPGKESGLVLDFTDNTKKHGPIDIIEIDSNGEVKKVEWLICPKCGNLVNPKKRHCLKCGYKFDEKLCPECQGICNTKDDVCKNCGHEFRREREAKHNQKASTEDILSTQDYLRTEIVNDVKFYIHKKKGKPDSMRVEYIIDLTTKYNEWICFEHEGYAREKAVKWWKKNYPEYVIPVYTQDAVFIASEAGLNIGTIKVKRDGKFWKVIS